MPAPAWLQVSGVSLCTDTTTTFTEPSTLVNDSTGATTMANDENDNHRTIQKFEHADLPKKMFLDRQIKKAKSLPGLIKGTALYRHTPLQSPQYHKVNGDDSKPVSVDGNPDDHLSTSTQPPAERPAEARRPRVVFADVNKVQFFEDDNDEIDANRIRRSRHRSAKRSTPLVVPNPTFAPSIQQSQSLYVPSSSSSSSFSRQQELNIRKQPIVASPRIHSSRITHLPDINNQSSTNDTPIRERYILQREKSFLRFPEPMNDQSINSSAEVSRESTRAGGTRPFAMPYVSDLNLRMEQEENPSNHFLNNSFTSSITASRQRTTFQSISLRQQFALPNKQKSTTHVRRSASMRHPSQFSNISEEELNGSTNNHYDYVAPIENRPVTGSSSSRRIHRSYISHFNTSKIPFNGHSTTLPDHHEQETFEQPLKILSSTYLANLHPSSSKKSNIDGSIRSSRTQSTRRSHEFQVTTNTVIV